jgi:MFS transporter, ACS family, tartrate transporter
MIGAPLSAELLSLHGSGGLAGWQWLLLVEGVPAIVMGAVAQFALIENPSRAVWLDERERECLTAALAREKQVAIGLRGTTRDLLARSEIWLLCGAYFALTWASYGVGLWLPEVVKSFSGYSDRTVSLLTAIPFFASMVIMALVGSSADRTRQPHWHFAGAVFGGGVAFFLGAEPHAVWFSTILLSLAVAGIYSGFGPFWAMPGEMLEGSSAATAIAVINSIGNLGGLFGPYVVGIAKQKTGNFAVGTIILGCVLCAGGVLALLAKRVKMGSVARALDTRESNAE